MNQKKLKKLRKAARQATVNMPEVRHVVAINPSLRTEKMRVVNHLKSTRGTYRWLKKQENML